YNYGGGVFSDNSNPTFRNCVFSNNIADDGGALEAVNSSTVTLENCRLENNSARKNGGAIFSWGAALVIADSCVLVKNQSGTQGGAIFTGGNGQISAQYCTITNNASSNGGAIFAQDNTSPALTNSIIYFNWPNEIVPANLNSITYCNVRGGYPGTGNLDTDPLFCNWEEGQYTLAANSPCLTAGSGGTRMGYFASSCQPVYPRTLNVPQEFPTIQQAILASYQGDTVLVAPGVYQENIDLWGRRVLLASHFILSKDTAHISATVIDGGGTAVNQSVITIKRGEDSLCVIQGLTLTNGMVDAGHGGGITINNGASPRIEDCYIVENIGLLNTTYGWGGIGICSLNGSSPVFERCIIRKNIASGYDNGRQHRGGGAYLSGGTPMFIDCQFDSNIVAYQSYYNYGGGVFSDNSNPSETACSPTTSPTMAVVSLQSTPRTWSFQTVSSLAIIPERAARRYTSPVQIRTW
ncbi:MAG: hypothetical protein GXO78_10015, partial [Calditrichaeota bacterium]|nr:hypothetical protein [Calditrichota bacterium]